MSNRTVDRTKRATFTRPHDHKPLLRNLDPDIEFIRACGQTPRRRYDEYVGRIERREEGETLIDTAMTLNAMHPDVLIVRHADSGAVKLLSEKVNCSVINAGDGTHEHPTQALLDALTIRRRKGRIHRLTVAICGDILHSRVARSNIHLLNTMGSRIRLVAPPTLLPTDVDRFGVEVFHNIEEGIKNCDIVMMLRLQNERMQGMFVPSIREYFRYFGLTREKLAAAKPDALVMHPGPMNRGVEIDSDLADDLDRSVIREQVEMGSRSVWPASTRSPGTNWRTHRDDAPRCISKRPPPRSRERTRYTRRAAY